jgi:UDP-N-acetylmuramoyl-L-alanyl-D-glutamate--2,6-diaminopimelate ligase
MLPQIYPVTCHTDHVGPGSTFVAIKGFKDDGTKYIEKAIDLGATKIVVEEGTSFEWFDKLTTNGSIIKINQQNIIRQNIQITYDKLSQITKNSEKNSPFVVSLSNHSNGQLNIQIIFVKNTRKALAELTAQALGNPASKLKIVGLTGTKGKTTTTYLIEHILKQAGFKTALLGTVKNKILDEELETSNTTPEGDYLQMFFAECVKRGVDFVVMEVSSHALSLHRVHGVEFDAVGFTNLNPEHLDFYKDMQDYFQAKMEIFNQIKTGGSVVVNSDNEWGRRAVEILGSDKNFENKILTFGQNKFEQEPLDTICKSKSLGETVYIKPINTTNPEKSSIKESSDTNFQLPVHSECATSWRVSRNSNKPLHHSLSILQNNLDNLKFKISKESNADQISSSKLFGEFNAYNMTMAFLICKQLEISKLKIQTALKIFSGVPGRLQFHKLKNGAKAFVDYAHNPSSMEAVLQTLRPLTKNLIVVFGCGGDRDKTKRPVMGKIACQHANNVIITSDNPRTEEPQDILKNILEGVDKEEMKKVTCQLDRKKAIEKAAEISDENSVIALLGKGHENYFLIKGQKFHFDDLEEISKF